MDYVEGETLDDFLAEHGGEDLTQRHRDTEAQSGRARSPSGPPGGLPEADVLRILRPIAVCGSAGRLAPPILLLTPPRWWLSMLRRLEGGFPS